MNRIKSITQFLGIALISLYLNREVKAQTTPTWSADVANIIYNNCSSCHRYGGLGTFSLMSYSETVSHSAQILDAVSTRKMPPWKPDPNYRHFKNETALSTSEISKIQQWIAGNTPQGNASQEPTPPTFNTNSQLQNIDQTIQTLNYTINSNIDVYRTFVIPSNTSVDRYLNEVEFIPGNNAVVHHIILFQDTSSVSNNLDVADPEPGFASNGTMQQSGAASYVALWAPGAGLFQLPPNMGIKIKAGADFLVEVHYAPNNLGQSDLSTINIKYTNGSNIREVKIDPVIDWGPSSLLNYPLQIPANQTKSFKQRWTNTSGDFSVLSIFPHMHKIGKSYKIYTTNLQGTDTTKYIYIPKWDFHWQGFYTFQKIQKLSLNQRLWGEAFYDNTTNNADNPSNPPVNVIAGEQTTNEMMITFLAYTQYQTGDENIVLDTVYFQSINKQALLNKPLELYPNPTHDEVYIKNINMYGNKYCFEIFDLAGNIVVSDRLITSKINVSEFAKGVYLLKIFSDKEVMQQKFSKD